MAQVQVSTGETVVAFRPMHTSKKVSIRADERRGAVLLFTGVRYERGDEALARASRLLERHADSSAPADRADLS